MAAVLVSNKGRIQGVVLQDGSEVRSKVVLSNASPQATFLKLTPQVRPGGRAQDVRGGCWSRARGPHEDGRRKCQVSALGEASPSIPHPTGREQAGKKPHT